MFAGDLFTPDSIIPFQTFREPRTDGMGFLWKPPELCATVAHFYFSERFRTADDALRREILYLPSAAEARKAAQRQPAPDSWMESRLQLVRFALWQQFSNLPGLAERIVSGAIVIGSGNALGQGWETRRRGTERWHQAVMKTATQFLSGGHMRLLVTGDTDVLNPFLITSRLAVLLAGKLPNQVLIGCRAGADAMAENWAIQNYVPVHHHMLRRQPSAAIDTAAVDRLANAATHALLFTRGEDSTVQAIRLRLGQRQIPTRLTLLDHDGRPIPAKTQSSARRRG